eukprot:7387962-Prymnesium_polylepis.4
MLRWRRARVAVVAHLLRVEEDTLRLRDAEAAVVKAHQRPGAEVARVARVVRPVGRRRNDRVAAATQQLPVAEGRVGVAWQPGGVTHHGERHVGRAAAALAAGRRRDWRLGRRLVAEGEHVEDPRRERTQRHRLVDQHRRELERARLAQPLDEIDDVHRGEADLAHRQREVERALVALGEHHHLGEDRAQLALHGASARGHVERRQQHTKWRESAGAGRRRRRRADGGDGARLGRTRLGRTASQGDERHGERLDAARSTGPRVDRPLGGQVCVVGAALAARGDDVTERAEAGRQLDEAHALPPPVALEAGAKAMRHAGAGPRAPRDRHGRQPALPPHVRQPILVRVGGGVVRELRVAQQAVDGGEEHKLVERCGAERGVKVVRAVDLGGRLRDEPLPAQLLDRAVARQPREVKHPAERLARRGGVREDLSHIRLDRHVRAHALDLGARLRLDRLDHRRALVVGLATPGSQQEASRAAPRLPGRVAKHLQAEPAQAARHDVRRVGPQRALVAAHERRARRREPGDVARATTVGNLGAAERRLGITGRRGGVERR